MEDVGLFEILANYLLIGRIMINCGDWFDNRHNANRNNNNEENYIVSFEKPVDFLFLTANRASELNTLIHSPCCKHAISVRCRDTINNNHVSATLVPD